MGCGRGREAAVLAANDSPHQPVSNLDMYSSLLPPPPMPSPPSSSSSSLSLSSTSASTTLCLLPATPEPAAALDGNTLCVTDKTQRHSTVHVPDAIMPAATSSSETSTGSGLAKAATSTCLVVEATMNCCSNGDTPAARIQR